ncbi:aspartate/glutamate racemase family protein [Fodinicola acaciae]|uniref:aspartate/glutamate racemase family protein n=1 Tax=Fodinicola acaciae TaxID=2681555 RepID=UPI0013D527D7|nr:aspartate/glutamate racemase family protein [Fodinicola acaciae]
MTVRIALISATPAAIAPAETGLAEEFSEALAWNILDDRLLADAADGLTPPLADRMRRLIAYAIDGGADGVLLTCSLYGPVVDSVASAVPVFAPDSAAFQRALDGGYRRIAVLASFETAMTDSLARFRAYVAGSGIEAVGVVAPDAFEAAKKNDLDTLFTALRDACDDSYDAVLLAQYSLAPAAERLSAALARPVISGPHAAAVALKAAIGGDPA